MKEQLHERMILLRMEKGVDRILPITGVLSALSALTVFFSRIPRVFFWIDLLIGAAFFCLYLFRQHVNVGVKLVLIGITATFIGTLSFAHGGFGSAGLTIYMMANVLTVMLLPKWKSGIFSVVTLILFGGMWLMAELGLLQFEQAFETAAWAIHYFMYILYLFFLHISVYSVRDYLLEAVLKLEKSVALTHKFAYYDQLTELPNKVSFERKVLRSRASGMGYGFIVLVTLRDLRMISSIHGNAVGDKVILEVAKFIGDILPKEGLLARVNSNEFGLWLPEISEEATKDILAQMGTGIMSETMKKEVYVTGCYLKIEEESLDVAMQKVAVGLAHAKKQGIKEVMPYDKKVEDAIVMEEAMHRMLNHAIDKDEFQLYYQFKKHVPEDRVVGVEALSRWLQPEMGIVSPGIFIPMVEVIGRSVEFGELMINKALSEYGKLCEKYGEGISLSVNVSPKHLLDSGFGDFLREALKRHDVPAEVLHIEVTEEIIIEGLEKASDIIDGLKDIGVKVALDDFGKGYSSLNYLLHLNIDELKVDKSFVDQLERVPRAEVLLALIINLTKAFNLSLVAEGVETEAQCKRLVDLGCYTIQGYYFSRPEPIDG